MNKEALATLGKKLDPVGSAGMYIISVFDLEPSGLIVQAYNHISSKEYLLPVSEADLAASGYTRAPKRLMALLETMYLAQMGGEYALASSCESIAKIKRRPTGEEVEKMLKRPIFEGSEESLHSLVVNGCVELCKVKPVGIDAVGWLGEWLLKNNPNKPKVDEFVVQEPPDDQV